MLDRDFFEDGFFVLSGQRPFKWQQRLFHEYFASFDPTHRTLPPALDIPTGLGKTSVVVIWLLALASQSVNANVRLPRRLLYVVNRRTVVDQATEIAERLRKSLKDASAKSPTAQVREALARLCLDPKDDASPLAISTLRGERADNREWQADPTRAAIIIGTVDMVGSRLLFSGYGVSHRMRPFHAGLLGQDALLVHDEAHLEPAFGKLVRAIAALQRDRQESRPLQVVELSATQSGGAEGSVFSLDNDDRAEAEVRRRIGAAKTLLLEDQAKEPFDAIAAMVKSALSYADARKRVGVYVRHPKDAKAIAAELEKQVGEANVAILTGTTRGLERDALASTPLFQGFRADPRRGPPGRTEYLVATSAGEVGVDLDADHLICDLTTLDSMIQRLGRVNRLGRGEAKVHVFERPRGQRKEAEPSDADERLAATSQALRSLPRRDGGYHASPDALRALAGRIEAFAPTPRVVQLTDILLDAWSLTRVEDLPGRQAVERWLHGIEASPPDLHVAWREEVNDLAQAGPRIVKILYDKHPVLARERLRGPLGEVVAELKKIADRAADSAERKPLTAVIAPASGDPIIGSLSDLLADPSRLGEATIVLPPEVGGLDARGMLDASERRNPSTRYDVADIPGSSGQAEDEAAAAPDRLRVLLTWKSDAEQWSARRLGWDDDGSVDAAVAEARTLREAISRVLDLLPAMAQRDLLVLDRDEEGEPSKALLLLARRKSIEAAQDNPAAAPRACLLGDHLTDVSNMAGTILSHLGPLVPNQAMAQRIAEAVVLAAQHHDRGKNRDPWQADIGNPRRGKTDWKPLAKSGQRGFVSRLSGEYRHEFGSLREATGDPLVREHPECDLILHLIAAHHGWARPHFKPEQWDIADGVSEDENGAVAADAMRRFARLQRRFGRWGLAWLEALVRAADYAATKRPSGSDVGGVKPPNSKRAEALRESAT